jgi:hypothetical protein
MKTVDGWRGHGPWERWFAWYPLMINGRSVWLQTVERRYQYRDIGSGAVERRWAYQFVTSSRREAVP